ncbi:hypothetical protein CU097_011518, partial [Rhizopus azygosporus]
MAYAKKFHQIKFQLQNQTGANNSAAATSMMNDNQLLNINPLAGQQMSPLLQQQQPQSQSVSPQVQPARTAAQAMAAAAAGTNPSNNNNNIINNVANMNTTAQQQIPVNMLQQLNMANANQAAMTMSPRQFQAYLTRQIALQQQQQQQSGQNTPQMTSQQQQGTPQFSNANIDPASIISLNMAQNFRTPASGINTTTTPMQPNNFQNTQAKPPQQPSQPVQQTQQPPVAPNVQLNAGTTANPINNAATAHPSLQQRTQAAEYVRQMDEGVRNTRVRANPIENMSEQEKAAIRDS